MNEQWSFSMDGTTEHVTQFLSVRWSADSATDCVVSGDVVVVELCDDVQPDFIRE